jgi:eukaryotic-like serine/threonine-protein kinase
MDQCSICNNTYDHAQGSAECPAQKLGWVIDSKYRLHRVLGVGSFGAVYEAQHLVLEKLVALKMLHSKFAKNEHVVKRFEGEARSVAKLHHRGIVQIFNIGKDTDNNSYIEMEFLLGEPLHSVIARGLPSVEKALEWFCQVLEALEEAHSQNIIHRDLKPANILLTRDHRDRDELKVLDFGIAKDLEGIGNNTATDRPLGTALYMSPEQAMNPTTVDARADIYSLGATLYRLLTNRHTLQGKALSVILTNLANDKIERQPSRYRAEVPAWLDRVVSKAMAFDPEERFVSVSHMLEAIQQGLRHTQQEKEEATRRDGEAPLRQMIAALQLQVSKMDSDCTVLQKQWEDSQRLLRQAESETQYALVALDDARHKELQQAEKERLLTSLVWLTFADGVILTLSGALEYFIGRSSLGEHWIPAVDLSGRSGVSRRHARLFWRNSSLFLEDLGSNNGTFVNGETLQDRPPRPVESGETLTFGDVDLWLSYQGMP